MIIRNNLHALNSLNALHKSSIGETSANQKLSSGRRINSAADDAAGSAISAQMSAQIRALSQANRNTNDGASMLLTAEATLDEVHNMLQRARELAVQAATDTYVHSEREKIQVEMDAIASTIKEMTAQANFNGLPLLRSDTLSTNYVDIPSDLNFLTGQSALVDNDRNVTLVSGTNPGVTSLNTNGATDDMDTWLTSFSSTYATQKDATIAALQALLPASGIASSDVGAALDSFQDFASQTFSSTSSLPAMSAFSNYHDKAMDIWDTYKEEFPDVFEYRFANDPDFEEYKNRFPGIFDEDFTPPNPSFYQEFDSIQARLPNPFSPDPILAMRTGNNSSITAIESLITDRDTAIGLGQDPTAFDNAINNAVNSIIARLENFETNFIDTDMPRTISMFESLENVATALHNASPKRPIPSYQIQVGANEGDRMTTSIPITVSAFSLNVSTIDLTSNCPRQPKLDSVITRLTKATSDVSQVRSDIGSEINRLRHNSLHLTNSEENLTNSNSRIADTDMALEFSKKVRYQVLTSAGINMLAQANQSPNRVLELISAN